MDWQTAFDIGMAPLFLQQGQAKVTDPEHEDRVDVLRTDLRYLKVYTIDPEGCTDADDAFSIVVQDRQVHLYVHIADPTALTGFSQELIDQAQTIYVSGHQPHHLFPAEIVERSSLIDGDHRAITIHSVFERVFERDQYFRCLESHVMPSWIRCGFRRLSYEQAADQWPADATLVLGSLLAQSLWKTRQAGLAFEPHRDLVFAHDPADPVAPHVTPDGTVRMIPDDRSVLCMRAMIAEFAIHVNQIMAQQLPNAFMRTLQGGAFVHGQQAAVSELIKVKSSAQYTPQAGSHDMVGASMYTHATSPLRRAADCIVHWMWKDHWLNRKCRFSDDQLHAFGQTLTARFQELRRWQFKDTKLRVFQWMQEQLSAGREVLLHVKFHHVAGRFLNLLLTKVNGIPIRVFYVLKRAPKRFPAEALLRIANVVPGQPFDEGTLPEVDEVWR